MFGALTRLICSSESMTCSVTVTLCLLLLLVICQVNRVTQSQHCKSATNGQLVGTCILSIHCYNWMYCNWLN